LNLTGQIKQKAVEIGFDLVGITTADPLDNDGIAVFKNWLDKGLAAQMSFFSTNFDKRMNPSLLLDGAKSIIVAAVSYKPPVSVSGSRILSGISCGKIASYAQYEDYHHFIRNNLQILSDFIIAQAGSNHQCKICVDSSPLAEKPLAARAGLGFIGKNHLLINPALGPQLFLGEIITTIPLEPDKPVAADCQNCDKCIRACPTSALRQDGFLDANKCISFLTIEYKGNIDGDLAFKIGDRLFGCDDCILACPYQKIAPACRNASFRFYIDRACLGLSEILNLNQKDFEKKFADSPLKRIGLERLKRNAKICLENINNDSSD
jgi:epoxyqueuosine reductase